MAAVSAFPRASKAPGASRSLSVLEAILPWACQVLQPITHFQAAAAVCMAILSGTAAFAGYTAVLLLFLSRQLTSLPPVQSTRLHFDYSSPMASAAVDLQSSMVPFPRPFLTQLQEFALLGSGKLPQVPRQAAQQYRTEAVQQEPPPSFAAAAGVQPLLQQQQQQSPPGQCSRPSDPGYTQGQQQQQQQQYDYRLPDLPWKLHRSTGSGARLLSSGQQVKISVQLRLPRWHKDLFQVSGELLTGAGEIIIRSTRTHMPALDPAPMWLARHLLLAPCYAVGACEDTIMINFVLFEGYVEQDDAQVQGFRALLTSRRSAAGALVPPPVQEAHLEVALKMGLLRKLLYWLRPSLTVALLLGSLAALMATTASGLAVFLALVALVWLQVGQRLGQAGRVPQRTPLSVWGWLLAHEVPASGDGTLSEEVEVEEEEEEEPVGLWSRVVEEQQPVWPGMKPRRGLQRREEVSDLWM